MLQSAVRIREDLDSCGVLAKLMGDEAAQGGPANLTTPLTSAQRQVGTMYIFFLYQQCL